ncbi:hypothetical protein QEN19_002364 [Hanseniaspora menglaensis]
MTVVTSANLITKNINIIGAGASGLYTCYKLLHLNNSADNLSNIRLNINVWDKLPIPFGLVRNGVAPDHPEIKNCIETFKEMFDNKEDTKNTVKFIGNFTFTKKEQYEELVDKSDLLFLATGCEKSRSYKLENKTTSNTLLAKDIVDWYNNYPHQGEEPNKEWKTKEFWQNIKRINIIGNGNVAFDLCRLFFLSKNGKKNIDKTDINSSFVNVLSTAPLEKVNIIGRRDFIHAKFGTREFRELWALNKYGVHGKIDSKYLPEASEVKSLSRAIAKRVQLAKKNMQAQQEENLIPPLTWELKFLSSPYKVDEKNKILYSKTNTLDQDSLKITSTNEVEEIKNDLVILSIGTQNDESSLFEELEKENSNKVKRVGWLKTHGSGSIAETMLDTFPLVTKEYENMDYLNNENSNEPEDMNFLKNKKNVLTTWNGFKAVEEYERLSKQGKKCASAEEMLQIAYQSGSKLTNT